MKQEILDLYDEYTHAPLERRAFLARLAQLAGGVAAAEALLPLLENNTLEAAVVAPDDARIAASRVTFAGARREMKGYLCLSKGEGRHPGVVVIHENRGLNAHIEDVARRAAVAGFAALAPDALSPLGGTPDDADRARGMFRDLDDEENLGNFVKAVAHLKDHAACTGKVGCVGFCWGGGMANQLAVHSPDLLAAVPFYGRQAGSGEVPKIKASLMLHYAALDERINSGIEAYETALKAAGVDYRLFVYEGVNHAFHNDTSAARYNKEAAELAWSRTVAFLKERLG